MKCEINLRWIGWGGEGRPGEEMKRAKTCHSQCLMSERVSGISSRNFLYQSRSIHLTPPPPPPSGYPHCLCSFFPVFANSPQHPPCPVLKCSLHSFTLYFAFSFLSSHHVPCRLQVRLRPLLILILLFFLCPLLSPPWVLENLFIWNVFCVWGILLTPTDLFQPYINTVCWAAVSIVSVWMRSVWFTAFLMQIEVRCFWKIQLELNIVEILSLSFSLYGSLSLSL